MSGREIESVNLLGSLHHHVGEAVLISIYGLSDASWEASPITFHSNYHCSRPKNLLEGVLPWLCMASMYQV
jgi:hypothetical protein